MLAKLMMAAMLLLPWYRTEESTAWLGVVMVDVPKALSAHLNTGDEGLMVINVIRDSPADTAGIQQYDVILRVDNEAIGGSGVLRQRGAATQSDGGQYGESYGVGFHSGCFQDFVAASR